MWTAVTTITADTLCLRSNAQSPSCWNKKLSQKYRFQNMETTVYRIRIFVWGQISPTFQGSLKVFRGPKVSDTCSSQHDYATELINLYLPSSCVRSYFCLSWQFLGLLIPSPAVWAVPRVILGQDRGVPWAVCTVPLLRLLSILSFAKCHHPHVHPVTGGFFSVLYCSCSCREAQLLLCLSTALLMQTLQI